MTRLHTFLLLLLLTGVLAISAVVAYAAEPTKPQVAPHVIPPELGVSATPVTTSDKPVPGATQIITDEKNNVVRVIIGGKEIVTIDAVGLHINGSVDYSGSIRDTGHEDADAP